MLVTIVFQYVKYTHTMITMGPGFTNLAKQLHSEVHADYLLWKASGKPHAGLLYFNMGQSRIRVRRSLKECKQNEERLCANAHAQSLFEKDMTSFWEDSKKNYDTRLLRRRFIFT